MLVVRENFPSDPEDEKMGCGQSKIHLYPRKSKSKANGKKSGNGEFGRLNLFSVIKREFALTNDNLQMSLHSTYN